MGSYAQQFTPGPGSIWYYQEEPAPPPPPPAVRYVPQESFGQPAVYSTLYPSVDSGLPIQNPVGTSFGTPASFENSGSGSRQGTSPVANATERRRYRIKRIRTACEECRKRKQRCDGSEYCGPCIEQGTHCRYRDIPPAKKDAMMQKMLELAEQHSEHLESITEGIEGMNHKLQGIEKKLSKQK